MKVIRILWISLLLELGFAGAFLIHRLREPRAALGGRDARPEEIAPRASLRPLSPLAKVTAPAAPEPVPQPASSRVAIARANRNLPAAVQWARHLPAGAEREAAILSVAYEAVRTEPTTALTLALELPADQAQGDLIVHAAAEWAATAPAAAAEWAKQIPDTELREAVLASVATAWGESDPRAAASLAVTDITGEKPQSDALVSIAQRWAQKDAAGAAGWVDSFPAAVLRDMARESLAALAAHPVPPDS